MGNVIAVSIGWHESDLTLGAISAMRSARRVFLRTSRCGAALWLKAEGVPFVSLDDLFDQAADYDDLIALTIDALLSEAREGDVLYCVNDPCDASLQALSERAGDQVTCLGGVMPGVSLLRHGAGQVTVLSAVDCPQAHIVPSCGCLVREIDDQFLAADVKLRLMAHYPDEWPVFAALPSGQELSLPLCELDQLETYDHRLCVMVPPLTGDLALNRPTIHHLADAASRAAAMMDAPADAADPADQCEQDGQALASIALRARQAENSGDYDLTDVIASACRHVRNMSQF